MLDCLTPTGRAWIARQRATVDRCAREWDADAIITDDRSAAPVDALFSRGATLLAVAEVKTRTMTLAALRDRQSYLVTLEKLIEGRELARVLRVPYLLIVGLDDAVVYWTVSDGAGEWRVSFTMARTPTAATCNGGAALRANAYLRLDVMKVLKPFTE